jgi:geranyl-CoA carboxylase alpha subunit
VQVVHLEAHHARVSCDGVVEPVSFVRDGPRLWFSCTGRPYEVVDTTRAASVRQSGLQGGDGKLRATMNGRVVAVLVAVGQRVQAGQAMLTLEAMKMEHVHSAPRAGVVKAIHVTTGEQVPASRVVAEIEVLDEGAP